MGKQRILICDDERGVRDSLKLILETEYHLIFATDGQEALEMIRKEPVDLAILDVKMPRLNGMETLRELKQLNPAPRVLMITGYESSDVAGEAIQAGADDYLTKPFERDTVREKVRALLPPV